MHIVSAFAFELSPYFETHIVFVPRDDDPAKQDVVSLWEGDAGYESRDPHAPELVIDSVWVIPRGGTNAPGDGWSRFPRTRTNLRRFRSPRRHTQQRLPGRTRPLLCASKSFHGDRGRDAGQRG